MDRNAAHLPVLPVEVVELLRPVGCSLIVDCTVGVGGHSELLLSSAGEATRLIGIDRDAGNLRLAKARLERFAPRVRLFEANFADVSDVLAEADEGLPDVLLADIGISSSQLDDPTRGFSFQADGPLDMRMDSAGGGPSAEEIVNALGESELADLIYQFGQERFSRRIAKAIVNARGKGRIDRTVELARIVAGAIPAAARARRRGMHPATRTFQALRIAVNDELLSLERLLDAMPNVLAHGARAGIISFHSLEDRQVKQAFVGYSGAGRAELLTKKPVAAGQVELAENPRSRSAHLRAIRWIG